MGVLRSWLRAMKFALGQKRSIEELRSWLEAMREFALSQERSMGELRSWLKAMREFRGKNFALEQKLSSK